MAFKTMNVHIPISVAQDMDDRGRLNPKYVGQFIKEHLYSGLNDNKLSELPYKYTFKLHEDVHKTLKLKSFIEGLSLQEITGRIFDQHYVMGVSDRGEKEEPSTERTAEGRDKATHPVSQ